MKKIKKSLNLKMSITIMLLGLVICLLIIFIGYYIYYKQIIGQYVKQGKVLISTASEYIDWDKTDDYLETLEEDEEYEKTLQGLRMLNKGADATYLYVLVPDKNGAIYVFDTDETEEQCELGYYWEWYEDFIKYKEDLEAGKPVGPVITDEEYGWLLSLYLPFCDSNGEFAGYLGVDYSVEHIMNQQGDYMRNLIIAALLLLVFMVVAFILLFQRMVLTPINKIALAANSFILGENGKMAEENSITNLNINTKDELQSLAEAIKSMERKIQRYIENLAEAVQKAETDTMTGLLNQGAFSYRVKSVLAHKIVQEDSIFMMIDIDYFKEINDGWGHIAGDEVLKSFAQAVSDNFDDGDMVARMGGDEFAVFSQGSWPMEKIEACAQNVRQAIHGIQINKELKVTASIGVAVCQKGQQKYRDFYAQADVALYEAKAAGRDGCEIRVVELI